MILVALYFVDFAGRVQSSGGNISDVEADSQRNNTTAVHYPKRQYRQSGPRIKARVTRIFLMRKTTAAVLVIEL